MWCLEKMRLANDGTLIVFLSDKSVYFYEPGLKEWQEKKQDLSQLQMASDDQNFEPLFQDKLNLADTISKLELVDTQEDNEVEIIGEMPSADLQPDFFDPSAVEA